MEKDPRQGYVVSCLRRYDGKGVYVNATSDFKPRIPVEVREKWQSLINHAANTLRQPHALITQLDQDTLHVFLHNNTDDTTFIEHDKFPLGLGVYCETTMTLDSVNFVPDALSDEGWKDNPSVDFSLISYIGVPIRWPDGELFGTICALGDKPLADNRDLFDSIKLFKSIVETDLQLLFEKKERFSNEHRYNTMLSESHHRIKNHLNILSGMIQLKSVDDNLTKEEFVAYQIELYSQIKAVAELHTLLTYDGRESVNLPNYLDKMIENWIKTVPGREVHVEVDFETVEAVGAKVVYFGLLVNELITNSFTHAFSPSHPNPTIVMGLEDNGDTFRFTYKDNGSGFQDKSQPRQSKSIGLSMVCELTKSMGGTLGQENESEASFAFVFPKRLE